MSEPTPAPMAPATPTELHQLRPGHEVVIRLQRLGRYLDHQIVTVDTVSPQRIICDVPHRGRKHFNANTGKGWGNEPYDIALVFDEATRFYRLMTPAEGEAERNTALKYKVAADHAVDVLGAAFPTLKPGAHTYAEKDGGQSVRYTGTAINNEPTVLVAFAGEVTGDRLTPDLLVELHEAMQVIISLCESGVNIYAPREH